MKRMLFTLAWLTALCTVQTKSTYAQQSLPALTRISKPNPAPSAPGDVFNPNTSGSPAANTPIIGEWTRTAGPDESIILTGVDFSRFTGAELGKDTRFTAVGINGIKADARVQRLEGDKAVITLSKNLPAWSTYMIWPGNDAGYGTPILVNKTDAWWVGPDKSYRGKTVSVFGRNLTRNNDTLSSNVFIKPAVGSGQWVQVKRANPYRVEFVVPSTLANGEYEVWVHNGHGGDYGWGGPVKLTVADDVTYTGQTFNVKNYGAKGDGVSDDLAAINSAISAASRVAGATVYFPAGTYMVSSNLEVFSNNRWKGDGPANTIIKCAPNYSTTAYGLVYGGARNFEMSDMSFNTNNSIRGYVDKTIYLRGSSDFVINNVNFWCKGGDIMDLHNTNRVFIQNCELVGKGSFLGTAKQLFIDNCVFKQTNDADMSLISWGSTGVCITNTLCKDLDNSNINSLEGWGKGRFYCGGGNWGANTNTYVGYNTTVDLTPSPISSDQNTGEQLMWEGTFTDYLGNIASATATAVTVNDLGFTDTNVRYVTIVRGRGFGQSRLITNYNGGTVTLSEPWNIIPDQTSVVAIGRYTDRVAVYKNYLDGKPRAINENYHIAVAGIEPFGGTINFVADNNTLHEMRQGTSNWSMAGDHERLEPNYFSLYVNNKYINCRTAIQNVTNVEKLENIAVWGALYRKNTIQNPLLHGIQNEVMNGSISGLIHTNVFEHNTFSQTPLGFSTRSMVYGSTGINGSANQILYKNSFNGNSEGLVWTPQACLRENTFSGYKSVYSNINSNPVLEGPFRVTEMDGVAGGDTVRVAFSIWNSGTAAMGWSATSSASWLTLSQNSGTIGSERDAAEITLRANPKNLAAGTHKAFITVSSGAAVKHFTVLLNVTGSAPVNQPPTVSLTAPANNATYTAPANVEITANAADADGTVSKVEFFQGSVKLGEDLSAPYNYTWSGVAQGTYTITAKSYDNSGAVTTSAAVNITVNAPANQLPSVSLTAPTAGAAFTAPATVNISANASDADGSITKVEFFQGATKLGEDWSAPYTFSWTGVTQGSYSITAKATDNSGAVSTSGTVNITVNAPVNQAPSVNLTSPANNATYTAPAAVEIAANASDADGTISRVEFYQGGTKLGEDWSAPYSFSWSNVAQGSYSITARAIDNSGAVTTSTAVAIVVNAPANQAPSVRITGPVANASFTAPATVAITAEAADADGSVSKVEFYQGATKIGESFTAPYTFTWAGVTAGTYTLTAKAFDNNGAVTTSAAVTINVNAPVNQLPTVRISAPATGASFTAPALVNITADAADADGTITKVEFFQGSVKLGEDWSAPYSFSWSGVNAGTYSITAKATDNSGAVTTSGAVSISVNAPVNQLPSVNLTAPATGASYTAPATVNISANASDVDGSVTKVEFYQGATKIGEAFAAPYNYTWSGVAQGTYTITAKAYDNSGAVTTSAAVNITVNAPANQLPSVSLTAPATGAAFTAPATVNISANASDADGSITKVEFFQGATKLGEDWSAPYTFSWTGVTQGSYSITAKATDNSGAVSTSGTVNITVNAPVNQAPWVNITSPANNSSYTAPASVNITANAGDADGTISRVEFYQGGTKLGEDWSAPYSFSWNNVAQGSYSITARAIDNSGAVTTSGAVWITVNKAKGPKVNLKANATTNRSSINVNMNADVIAGSNNIVKVEFFECNEKIGESTKAPYTFEWKNAPVGEHIITAVVTTENGMTATSEPISLSVKAPVPSAPAGSSLVYPNPMRGAGTFTFTLPTKAHVVVRLYDLTGKVVAQLFEGMVEANTAKPVQVNVSNLPAGMYICRAVYNDGTNYYKASLEEKIIVNK